MSIAVLPDRTVRLLGAFQHAPSPESIVKELIDNAIDASATSVQIEIAANSLDHIQVRDNGHGVPAADRPLLCRANCTSKISGLDDLRSIGGKSLGFRGTALASILSVAGSVHITTRVDGETTASLSKLSHSGTVQKVSVAAPRGTSVKVIDLFKTLPVRRQAYPKSAPKTFAKIRHTVQVYALAHPDVRYSFSVQNSSTPVVLTATPAHSLEQAALKVFGRECAGQCTVSSAQQAGYKLTALLPTVGAKAASVNGHGLFVTVDARPVSTARGLLHQLQRHFRESYAKAATPTQDIQNPFGLLRFSCPTGTYDINIEPLKDDVLFENPDCIQSLLSEVLGRCYELREDIEIDNSSGVNEQAQGSQDITAGALQVLNYAGRCEDVCGTEDRNPWVFARMNSMRSHHAQYSSLQQHSDLPHAPTSADSPLPVTPTQEVAGKCTPGAREPPSNYSDSLGRVALRSVDRNVGDRARIRTQSILSTEEVENDNEEELWQSQPFESRANTSTTKAREAQSLADSNIEEPIRTAPKRSLGQVATARKPFKQLRLGTLRAPDQQSIKMSRSQSPSTRAKMPFKRPRFIKQRHGRMCNPEEQSEQTDTALRVNKQSVPPYQDLEISNVLLGDADPRLASQSETTLAGLSNIISAEPRSGAIVRAVEALSVSLEAIKECCSILKTTQFGDEQYPDIPLMKPDSAAVSSEEPTDEDECSDCPTPETMRPTSLNHIDNAEVETWRKELLEYLEHANEGTLTMAKSRSSATLMTCDF